MVITILDEQFNDVVIIPEHFTDAEAIAAAKEAVREAALAGKTFAALDEDGEDVLPPEFVRLMEFIPSARRIAEILVGRMPKNRADFDALLSDSVKMSALIHSTIIEYFKKQNSIGQKVMALEGKERQRFHEMMWDMMFPAAA